MGTSVPATPRSSAIRTCPRRKEEKEKKY